MKEIIKYEQSCILRSDLRHTEVDTDPRDLPWGGHQGPSRYSVHQGGRHTPVESPSRVLVFLHHCHFTGTFAISPTNNTNLVNTCIILNQKY